MEAGLHGRIMKPDTPEIVMQEMNWASNQSERRLIEDQKNRLSERSLLQIQEQIKLERWFLKHDLPIPPNPRPATP